MAENKTTVEDLRTENERLTLEKANAQLKTDVRALTTPWWRQLSSVAPLTAILAAIIPATAAVEGCYRNERERVLAERKQSQELTLADNKQAHEIQLAYFHSYRVPGERLRTLRFVLATARDESVTRWATAELQVVAGELEEIDRQVAELRKKLADLALSPEQRMELKQELAQLTSQRSAHMP